MDRYSIGKAQDKVKLARSDLHLIGLVSVYISSKFEDVIPIHMDNILKDAGHGKFTQ
jgi:hypothetical protein